MRLLVFSDTYPPQVNGVSVVTDLMVRGLAARGWTCRVVVPRYPAQEGDVFARDDRRIERVAIPSLPLPVYPDVRLAWPALRRTSRVAAEFRPDLVHAATEFVMGRLGARVARRLGVKLCTSYHTDFGRYAASYGVPWLRGPVNRSIARFHRRAARVFTPSAQAQAALGEMGVPNVEVWGRGVDTRQFSPGNRSQALRERLGVPTGAFLFLHVGRLAPEKGVERLLSSFRMFRAMRPQAEARLIVAGAGPSLSALRADAPPGVTFLGNVERSHGLPALYATADAFLFASLTETLGLVVLEAMASRLPVIASPAGGVADQLRDEVNGLAYADADASACAVAMRRLVDDAGLRARLAAGARAWALQRSWDLELDRLDASYREVLSRSP